MIASFLVDCRPKNITALLEVFFKKCFFKKKKISEPAKLKYEVKDKNILFHTANKYWPTNIYLFKVNKKNIGKRCEIFSVLTIKTPDWRKWCHYAVFILNFEHILHIFPVFIVSFEKVKVCWIVSDVFKKRTDFTDL